MKKPPREGAFGQKVNVNVTEIKAFRAPAEQALERWDRFWKTNEIVCFR